MQIAFELLRVTQEIQGAQLAEIIESTRRYANELAYQRASIHHQEVMMAHLCCEFMPNQGKKNPKIFVSPFLLKYIAAKPLSVFRKGVLLNHFENHIY
ncbi:hypothetical protein M9H77_20686 [Catharanthus roseus]|uniref:Uncharacterized protein n=1 Tax=Catharanthus roseus TaxID=4058 RepID=A0ACC0AK88_CATRO|nr:hypothetical protein M9H77_20686 [Catharanthus roseus]